MTGRQHQIRVHFASLGHPIVGDKLYGASEALFMRACDEGVTDELLACFDGLPRHALHAHRLSFPHPVTKQTVTVESPLPADITAYIDALRTGRRDAAQSSDEDDSSTREMLTSMRLTSSPASDRNSSRGTPSLSHMLRSVTSSTSLRARRSSASPSTG